jgi:hypothetical protein
VKGDNPEVREGDFGFVYLDVDNPIIAWLAYRGILNSPDIETANPGNLSWFFVDVLKRGLASTIRREGALEGFRIREFAESLSRLRCIYAYPTVDSAARGDYGRGKFRKENLVAIAPAIKRIRIERYDGKWITDFSSLPLDSARRYWRGDVTGQPHFEYLLTGRFWIYGTSVRKRAYATIKKTWPNALALLELSRLAVEFNSDFGSISPWLMKNTYETRVQHVIRYDEKEGPEILKRAIERATTDPDFHVNWIDLEPFRLPPNDRDADARFAVPDTRPYDHVFRMDKMREMNEAILTHVNAE